MRLARQGKGINVPPRCIFIYRLSDCRKGSGKPVCGKPEEEAVRIRSLWEPESG